jgi:hypothetical protein
VRGVLAASRVLQGGCSHTDHLMRSVNAGLTLRTAPGGMSANSEIARLV